MTDETLLYVGFCSCCGTGPMGIRICHTCRAPLVMCDECDAVWLSPEPGTEPLYPEQPQLPCPHCGHSLRDGSHWGTRQELTELGWVAYVRGEGAPLKTGSGFDESPAPPGHEADAPEPSEGDSAADSAG